MVPFFAQNALICSLIKKAFEKHIAALGLKLDVYEKIFEQTEIPRWRYLLLLL